MLESKFLFVSKILFLAFIIINISNFFPFTFDQSSYWFILFTTIFDTATLLVLSLSVSKYINLKNLKFIENLYVKDSDNQNFIEKINLLKTKIIRDTKISFIVFIFFLISTLLQPVILLFDINKSDIYSTTVIESINKDFYNKKKNIEDIIAFKKTQTIDADEINKLETSISNLLNIRDKNIEQFMKSNTKNKFNTSKIIIRNVILGFLWAFVFYKLYII